MTTGQELSTRKAVSAGGVIYRRVAQRDAESAREIEVVLCGRNREGLWALPKGTPMAGESLRETALREVREETGLGVAIVGELGAIEYEFSRSSQGVRYEKTVHYFLMTPDGTGATELHDAEYDSVEWVTAAEAMRLLTHTNEQDVLRRAIKAIDAIETGAAA